MNGCYIHIIPCGLSYLDEGVNIADFPFKGGCVSCFNCIGAPEVKTGVYASGRNKK